MQRSPIKLSSAPVLYNRALFFKEFPQKKAFFGKKKVNETHTELFFWLMKLADCNTQWTKLNTNSSFHCLKSLNSRTILANIETFKTIHWYRKKSWISHTSLFQVFNGVQKTCQTTWVFFSNKQSRKSFIGTSSLLIHRNSKRFIGTVK